MRCASNEALGDIRTGLAPFFFNIFIQRLIPRIMDRLYSLALESLAKEFTKLWAVPQDKVTRIYYAFIVLSFLYIVAERCAMYISCLAPLFGSTKNATKTIGNSFKIKIPFGICSMKLGFNGSAKRLTIQLGLSMGFLAWKTTLDSQGWRSMPKVKMKLSFGPFKFSRIKKSERRTGVIGLYVV